MYSDLSFVSFLTVCAVVFIYMRLAVVVTTSVSSSNNNNNNYIPFAGHLQSHIISQRSAFAALYRVCNAAEVIFGFVPSAHGRNTPRKKQVMPSETSHPISFVMKRLVELTMTNGRWHTTCQKKLAEDPGPGPPDFGIIHKINRRTHAVFVL